MNRVYTRGGSVAHELRYGGSPNNRAAKALCGLSPWPSDWFGTGTQDEYERAAELPFCALCWDVKNRAHL